MHDKFSGHQLGNESILKRFRKIPKNPEEFQQVGWIDSFVASTKAAEARLGIYQSPHSWHALTIQVLPQIFTNGINKCLESLGPAQTNQKKYLYPKLNQVTSSYPLAEQHKTAFFDCHS